MNKFLADKLIRLNSLLATVIIVVSISVGAAYGELVGYLVSGVLIGLLGGALVAVLSCGFIAMLADIRRLLVEIRDRTGSPTEQLRDKL